MLLDTDCNSGIIYGSHHLHFQFDLAVLSRRQGRIPRYARRLRVYIMLGQFVFITYIVVVVTWSVGRGIVFEKRLKRTTG